MAEAAEGDPAQAAKRLAMLESVPVLDALPEAEALARRILAERLLPPFAVQDAVFIALAAVHQMDVLMSWNCRHLANAALQAPLRRLALGAGLDLPVLCTPDELMEDIR